MERPPDRTQSILYDMCDGLLSCVTVFMDANTLAVFCTTCKRFNDFVRISSVICKWLLANMSKNWKREGMQMLMQFFACMSPEHRQAVMDVLSPVQRRELLQRVCHVPVGFARASNFTPVGTDLARALLEHACRAMTAARLLASDAPVSPEEAALAFDASTVGLNTWHINCVIRNRNDPLMRVLLEVMRANDMVHIIDASNVYEASWIHDEDAEVTDNFRAIVDAAADNNMHDMLGRSLISIHSYDCVIYVLMKGAVFSAFTANDIARRKDFYPSLQLASRLVRQCTEPHNIRVEYIIKLGHPGPVYELLDAGASVFYTDVLEAFSRSDQPKALLQRLLYELPNDQLTPAICMAIVLKAYARPEYLEAAWPKLCICLSSPEVFRDMYRRICSCDSVPLDALGKLTMEAVRLYQANHPHDKSSQFDMVAMFHEEPVFEHTALPVLVRHGLEVLSHDMQRIADTMDRWKCHESLAQQMIKLGFKIPSRS